MRADDLARILRCPLCSERFRPADAGRPHEPPAAGDTYRLVAEPDEPRHRLADSDSTPRRVSDGEHPADLIAYALATCRGPSGGLILVGVLTVLLGLVWLIPGALPTGGGWAARPLFVIGYGVYAVAVGAFVVYAGVRMRQAKQYTLCLIACGLVLVPVVSPCCLLSLVFGIGGLTCLGDRRVRQGFAANRPGFDPDAG